MFKLFLKYSINQFRALKCFLDNIVMNVNVTGVLQNTEYATVVPSAGKKVENHWATSYRKSFK